MGISSTGEKNSSLFGLLETFSSVSTSSGSAEIGGTLRRLGSFVLANLTLLFFSSRGFGS